MGVHWICLISLEKVNAHLLISKLWDKPNWSISPYRFHLGSFSIHLLGGAAPNIGRVEVKYDDLLADVCYESRQSETRDWSFTNVQVVCKELGFPGAMIARRGGYGEGRRQYTMHDFKCNKGKNEFLGFFSGVASGCGARGKMFKWRPPSA